MIFIQLVRASSINCPRCPLLKSKLSSLSGLILVANQKTLQNISIARVVISIADAQDIAGSILCQKSNTQHNLHTRFGKGLAHLHMSPAVFHLSQRLHQVLQGQMNLKAYENKLQILLCWLPIWFKIVQPHRRFCNQILHLHPLPIFLLPFLFLEPIFVFPLGLEIPKLRLSYLF